MSLIGVIGEPCYRCGNAITAEYVAYGGDHIFCSRVCLDAQYRDWHAEERAHPKPALSQGCRDAREYLLRRAAWFEDDQTVWGWRIIADELRRAAGQIERNAAA